MARWWALLKLWSKAWQATNPVNWAKWLIPKTTQTKIAAATPNRLKSTINKGGQYLWRAWVVAGWGNLAFWAIKAATDPDAVDETTPDVELWTENLWTEGAWWSTSWGGWSWGAGWWYAWGVTLENILKNNLQVWDTELGDLDTDFIQEEPDTIKWLWLVDKIIKRRWKTETPEMRTQYDRGLTKRETPGWTR